MKKNYKNMELSDKLTTLLYSFIEKATKLEHLRSNGRESLTITHKDDKVNYTMTVRLAINSLDRINAEDREYVIVFKDLEEKISAETHHNIFETVQIKVEALEKTEMEKAKLGQVRLVDDLLKKFK